MAWTWHRYPLRSRKRLFFKGKHDLQEIGKILGVKTVLEGSIQRIETKLRARVQLIRIADGEHLWSAEFDRDVKDLFAIQDEIALAVVDKLKLTLLGDERARLSKHQAVDPAAHEEYLKGLEDWWQWSDEGMTKALNHFNRAIQIAPDYAQAHAGRALAYISASTFILLWPPREEVPRGMEMVQEAIALDPALPESYIARGLARQNYYWSWDDAEKDFRRALELTPNSALALDSLASFVWARGRFDESATLLRKALEQDPLSPALYGDLGWTYYYSNRYSLAVPQFRKALELDGNFHMARWGLGLAYQFNDESAQAAQEFQILARWSSSVPLAQGALGYYYAITGRPDEAKKVLSGLEELGRKRYISQGIPAVVYLGLGQKSFALGCLEKGFREHDFCMWSLSIDPLWEPLRDEPRFQALVKQIGSGK